jgi:hypothetical protein
VNPVLWHDFSTGVYQDSGTSTPCTDGTALQHIVDQSGNGNDGQQATSGNRPTWHSNPFGSLMGVNQAGASFNASNSQYLLHPYNVANGITLFVIGMCQGTGDMAWMGLEASSGNLAPYYFKPSNSASLNSAVGEAGGTTLYGGRNTNIMFMQLVTISNNTVTLWQNGVQVASASFSGQASPGSNGFVGASYYGGNPVDFLTGIIRHLFIFPQVLGSIDIAACFSWGRSYLPPAPSLSGVSYIGAFFDSTNEVLVMGTSSDGINFQQYPISYVPSGINSGSVGATTRDPRIIQNYTTKTVWNLAHTSISLSTGLQSGMAQTTDFAYWTSLPNLDWSDVTGSPNQAWAPNLYVDGSGNTWVYCAVGNSSGPTHAIWYKEFTAADLSSAGSSTETSITSAPTNIIDPFLLLYSGTYYLFFANNTGGYVGYASCSTQNGTYTVGVSGASNTLGLGAAEGPFFVTVGSNLTIYVDATGAAHLEYSQPSGGPTGTYPTPSNVNLTAYGGGSLTPRHGTIINYSAATSQGTASLWLVG